MPLGITFSAGNKLNAADIQALVTALDRVITKTVVSTAGGTGVTTTETKDATGDLAFTAVSGYTYTVKFQAAGRAGASGHVVDVNIRDGGASSPTNASTQRAGVTVALPATTMVAAVTIVKELRCPTDIAAGTHTLAAFYVRNANGTTTSVVQLENAGPDRRLSVSAAQTL